MRMKQRTLIGFGSCTYGVNVADGGSPGKEMKERASVFGIQASAKARCATSSCFASDSTINRLRGPPELASVLRETKR